MRVDHLSCGFKFGPKARVFKGILFAIRDKVKVGKYLSEKKLSLYTTKASRPLYPMPQLGYRNESETELFVWQGVHPGIEVKSPPFGLNDDVGIDQDCHLSTGGINILRASSSSWSQSVASSSPR